MSDALQVLVVEPHGLMRRGFEAALCDVDGIEDVTAVGSVAAAWSCPVTGEADLVLANIGVNGALDFVAGVVGFADPKVAVYGAADARDDLLAALELGAHAALDEEALSPEGTVLAVRAIAAGGTFALSDLFDGAGPPGTVAKPALSDREQQVLTLVADGLPTREVALEMSYSERTVKKVLGDVVIKLGARSRSQAIAQAVRKGII